MDDEERSSGEFQGTGMEHEDHQGAGMDHDDQDVIRALGPGNVQRLASMHAADLADLAEDSQEEGGVDDDSYDDSSEPESLDATPALVSCTNCTNDFEPGQTVCPVSLALIAHYEVAHAAHCSCNFLPSAQNIWFC